MAFVFLSVSSLLLSLRWSTEVGSRLSSSQVCLLVNQCVHFVVIVSLSMTTVTRPLSAGRMFSSFLSRLSACCSSFVKLLSCSDTDCKVEAILPLMLSLVGSDSSRCRDRAASTLDTIASVGYYYRLHTNDSFLTLTLQMNRTERPNFTDESLKQANHDRLTPLESYSQ